VFPVRYGVLNKRQDDGYDVIVKRKKSLVVKFITSFLIGNIPLLITRPGGKAQRINITNRKLCNAAKVSTTYDRVVICIAIRPYFMLCLVRIAAHTH
jgi:hypothetical protein